MTRVEWIIRTNQDAINTPLKSSVPATSFGPTPATTQTACSEHQAAPGHLKEADIKTFSQLCADDSQPATDQIVQRIYLRRFL